MSSFTQPYWKRTIFAVLAALVVLSLLLSACAPAAVQPANTIQAAGSKPGEKVTVRLAELLIMDALPFYVAQKQGYFAENNIDVSFVPVASAAERDQVMASGQADGMINDLISLAIYNKQNTQIQTVGFARVATPKIPMYRILAAKDSNIKSAADLANVPIGISQGTVIDYITSRLLEKEGVKADQIKTVAVPKMPDRLALLSKGEVKAATMPEPYSTIAQQAGATVIVDDSKYPDYGNSVISFHKSFIDQHPEAVKGFMAAVEKAKADINKDPEKWRSLLGDYKMVPAAIQATYPIPVFPSASVPSEAQWKDVVDWAKSRKMVENDISYTDSITSQFLAK
jgi:NitT/TauT family transport system substrate-binding protein